MDAYRLHHRTEVTFTEGGCFLNADKPGEPAAVSYFINLKKHFLVYPPSSLLLWSRWVCSHRLAFHAVELRYFIMMWDSRMGEQQLQCFKIPSDYDMKNNRMVPGPKKEHCPTAFSLDRGFTLRMHGQTFKFCRSMNFKAHGMEYPVFLEFVASKDTFVHLLMVIGEGAREGLEGRGWARATKGERVGGWANPSPLNLAPPASQDTGNDRYLHFAMCYNVPLAFIQKQQEMPPRSERQGNSGGWGASTWGSWAAGAAATEWVRVDPAAAASSSWAPAT